MLVGEGFGEECLGLVGALVLPSGYVHEVLVVAECLAVGRLMFYVEVAAAGLFALQGVDGYDF